MAKTTTFSGDMIITKLVKENPKRVGSAAYDRFKLYKSGMKVSKALEVGLTRADLSWDTSHGFIEIKAGDTPKSEKSKSEKPKGEAKPKSKAKSKSETKKEVEPETTTDKEGNVVPLRSGAKA